MHESRFSTGQLYIEMEYADGGTLRDLIVRQGSTHIPEPDIIWSDHATASQ